MTMNAHTFTVTILAALLAVLTPTSPAWAERAWVHRGAFGDSTLLLILAGVLLVSWLGLRLLAARLPSGAQIAARNI